MITKEHILSEIRRTATANDGNPLGRKRFEKETGIKEADWYGKFWTKWSTALEEAGYKPNKMQPAYNSEFLLEKLVSFISEIGRFPTSADLRMKARNDKTFPSHNTFARLGAKLDRARKVIEYCEAAGSLSKVLDLTRLHIAEMPNEQIKDSSAEEMPFGFVYLMKSGRYYKIGRSDYVEKRAYEVQLQLPERLRVIHKIKTDDPIGIEAYWHQRFADKRKRGEWFELNSQDVKAFRRRKFM